MSADEPTKWQIATAVMDNICAAQHRAEVDSIRFIVIVAGFLVVRGSDVSKLSIVGLEIDDLKVIQFMLVPIAALLVLRYVRTQAVTASLASFLNSYLTKHFPDVPELVCPVDWDLMRDMNHLRIGRPLRSLVVVVMYGFVLAGTIVNSIDATAANIWWAILCGTTTILIILATFFMRLAWSTAVIQRAAR